MSDEWSYDCGLWWRGENDKIWVGRDGRFNVTGVNDRFYDLESAKAFCDKSSPWNEPVNTDSETDTRTYDPVADWLKWCEDNPEYVAKHGFPAPG